MQRCLKKTVKAKERHSQAQFKVEQLLSGGLAPRGGGGSLVLRQPLVLNIFAILPLGICHPVRLSPCHSLTLWLVMLEFDLSPPQKLSFRLVPADSSGNLLG